MNGQNQTSRSLSYRYNAVFILHQQNKNFTFRDDPVEVEQKSDEQNEASEQTGDTEHNQVVEQNGVTEQKAAKQTVSTEHNGVSEDMNEEDKGVDEDVDEGPAVGKDCEIKTQVY